MDPNVQTAILAILGFLVAQLGPRPMQKLLDALHIDSGVWSLVLTYAASFLVAGVAVVAAIVACKFPFLNFCYQPADNVFAVALAVAAGAQLAFHNLKDAGKI
jgi:hypothetical protein